MSNFYSKLIKVQATLNAPKGQFITGVVKTSWVP
jgi:hypothetical protein